MGKVQGIYGDYLRKTNFLWLDYLFKEVDDQLT